MTIALRPGAQARLEALIEQSLQQITYMLAWESMAQREELWSRSVVDAEWIRVAAESEREGPLVQNIANPLLQPTAFSALK